METSLVLERVGGLVFGLFRFAFLYNGCYDIIF